MWDVRAYHMLFVYLVYFVTQWTIDGLVHVAHTRAFTFLSMMVTLVTVLGLQFFIRTYNMAFINYRYVILKTIHFHIKDRV